jgi:hypothetical protein
LITAPTGECDLILAAQRSFLAPNTGLNVEQFPLRGIEQIAPFARALVGKQRVATGNQALAGIVGRSDLGEIALVKERKLNGASLGEAADRRRAQGRDEVETGRFDGLLDASLGDHAAIADQNHALELEALLELFDLVRHRRGIADIAFEHLDRHRAALGRAQQSDHDLQLAPLAVAAVA